MNERTDGRIGVPGGSRPGAATGAPGHGAGPVGVPGSGQSAETDRLLRGVEDDLSTLEELNTPDQVPVYDRMHASLAEALARTADTGAPAGEPGA